MHSLGPNGLGGSQSTPAGTLARPGRDRATSVIEQIASAGEAQRGWGARSVRHRLVPLRRLRKLIAANAMRLVEAVQSSRGNPLAEVLACEVSPLADACRFLEREAGQILRSRRLAASSRPLWLAGVCAEVRHEPFGTVLVIGPFNYPLFLPGVRALQALIAGNAVLLKPGEGGTPAATEFVRLCRESGFDPELLQLLPESAEAAGEAIDAGVDKVILTGSARTGEKVLTRLAPRLVPAIIELSGCDAAFIQPDADLELAARALRFALVWNGDATCIAPRRVFVDRRIAAELEAHLAGALRALPHTSGRWKLDSRADALVRDAIKRGARPLTDSVGSDNRAAHPTVLADAGVDMLLLHQDVFAPVLALVPVSSDAEALEAAGRCPFALGAKIFGEERRALVLAKRVHASVVLINDVIVPTADLRLPFGGQGRSGFGHELVRRYIEAVHGSTWKQRWVARWTLLGNLIQKGLTGPAPGESRQ